MLEILRRAVEQSVQAAGQPPAVAQRLIAWIEAVVSGNEDLSDKETSRTRMERLMEAVIVPTEEALGGDE